MIKFCYLLFWLYLWEEVRLLRNIIIFGGNILRVIFDYCYSCYGNENGGVFVLE